MFTFTLLLDDGREVIFRNAYHGTFEHAYAAAVVLWDALPHVAGAPQQGIRISDSSGTPLMIINYITHER